LSWKGGPDKYYKNGTVNFVAVPEDVAARAVGPCHDDVPKAASTSWVCGHCTKYAGGPEQLQGVTAHVKTVYVSASLICLGCTFTDPRDGRLSHGKAQPDGLDILLAPGVLSINGSYSITRPGTRVANSRKAKVLFLGEEVGRRGGVGVGAGGASNNNGAFRCLRCEKPSRGFAGVGPVSDHLRGK
jgi:hypothetical protein